MAAAASATDAESVAVSMGEVIAALCALRRSTSCAVEDAEDGRLDLLSSGPQGGPCMLGVAVRHSMYWRRLWMDNKKAVDT